MGPQAWECPGARQQVRLPVFRRDPRWEGQAVRQVEAGREGRRFRVGAGMVGLLYRRSAPDTWRCDGELREL